jgi:sugar transferase (PEP-CTERM/EpsH1 system associated)
MNVLFLTHRLPYAPNRGDRIRAYHLLRELSRFAHVSLFSLVHNRDELAQANQMPFAERVRVARVGRIRNAFRATAALSTNRPLTHALLDGPGATASLGELRRAAQPDLVLAYCSGMARFALEPPLADMPVVVDLVDVDSVKWAMLGEASRGVRRWIYRREATTLGAFEADAARRARMTLVVNEREQAALRRCAPGARVTIIPNGIDMKAFEPHGPPEAAPVVIFCGVMNYQPNVNGVIWFARSVWPQIVGACPAARFVVVGADPVRAVTDLGRDRSIRIVGGVDRVEPHLWRAAVSVAPLHMARGLQNKVLEALAAGLPVVVTPGVFEGLPTVAQPGCSRAATPDEFGAAVLRLLQMTPAERRHVAASANLNSLMWESQLRPLEGILRASINEQFTDAIR